MSDRNPIIAITGSSGAGTTSVKVAFERMFQGAGVTPAIVEGDGFHRYDRCAMQKAFDEAQAQGRVISHFGPEANLFDDLEAVFREYSERRSGRRRWYIHNEEESALHHRPVGTITPWEALPEDTDLLFYEGLHGGLNTDTIDLPKYVDLLVGVVPTINLEWIQKIHRDASVRGYSAAAATEMILSRMHDYVHYIVPQFSKTDINFQRVPTVDTSNPFGAAEIPTNRQSFEVIHIRDTTKLQVDFRSLVTMIDGAFMSAADTIVIPAAKRSFAMEQIINPVLRRMTGK